MNEKYKEKKKIFEDNLKIKSINAFPVKCPIWQMISRNSGLNNYSL